MVSRGALFKDLRFSASRESPGVLLKKDPSINMGKARFELAKDNPLGLQPSAFDRLAISPCIESLRVEGIEPSLFGWKPRRLPLS